MYTLPDDLAAQLKPEVAAYIPTFKPQRLLDDAQWNRCNVSIWTAGAKTFPPTREDAKTHMSVLCGFLACTDRLVGSVDLDVVLTEAMMVRYLREVEGTVPRATLANRMAHLKRALRAAAGDAPRHVYHHRVAQTPPYSDADLHMLIAAAAGSSALAAALARGLVDGSVYPATVGTPAPSAARMIDTCRRFGLGDDWVAQVPDNVLTCDEWKTARSDAEAAGVSLTARQLRVTWLCDTLTRPGPIATDIQAHGLTRRDLDAALPHLSAGSEEEVRQALRG